MGMRLISGIFAFSMIIIFMAMVSGHAETLGTASFYGRELKGHRTANGERFNPAGLTAAHRTLPFGTTLRVTNLRNHKSVVVRVTDRGPHKRGRLIDLSYGAAKAVGMLGMGTTRVSVAKIAASSQASDKGNSPPRLPPGRR
ncbi:septal ring lytic transglycosylase RlpA family protein [Labrys neptuniae]|uniref:septal ring lytic transglycosylase RlpA family protein n=1 Tax=Labrys TaxID=204476 RepID=UPI002892279D|nr:septal ring lytic transglycosylase RlpA family protein [Labrys neptuniae]MDT3381045.1 septal ring lytic transglycosylase RlpA family protein [Labrys neptuniae]